MNSVDFWVEELTHDINPEHFNHHENFIPYMHDEKISSFGNWMWNNGYNVGLVNLQTKINTYCVSQWISVKDKLPDTTGIYFVYMPNNAEQHYGTDVYIEPQHTWACNQTYITHWMLMPTLPESEDDAENSCMKEASEGEWIIHFDDLFPEESTQECSICHAEQYLRYGDDDNYCPNCGAKMKQAEKG